MNTKERDRQYVCGTYARYPIELVRGEGERLWDSDGREYIDMGSGIAVNAFGAADPGWVAAVTAQLQTLQHTSNLYYTAPCAQLAEELCRRTGMKKVFFSNSGAESNECAIKVARKYAAAARGPAYSTIITLKNSFHGRTVTTLAATGQEVFHRDFQPLTPGFVHAEANNLADVERLAAANPCAAILLEVVQGEGGVNRLEPAFVQGVAALAKREGLLLMVDEVQTGNGRTGKLYGYMHYGITPDVVTTAKGLAGGLPLGATLLGERVQDVLQPGDHGSTFGGNPVCCAGALYVLSRLDEALLAEVTAKSAYLVRELTGAPGVVGVTGLGLMLGVETTADAGALVTALQERGVLALRAKNKLRLLPPLTISWESLEKAAEAIRAVCAEQK